MSPDGRLAAAWRLYPFEVTMRDASSYSVLWTNNPGGSALKAAWSFDSRWFAIGVSQELVHRVNVYNPLTGDLVHSFPTISDVWGIEFNPAGKPAEMLVSNADGSANVFDLNLGKEVSHLPGGPGYKSGHHSKYSPDGKLVSTIRSDDRVVIRDPLSGESRGPTIRHSLRIYDSDFSPGQQLLATASVDRSARLWDLTTGEPVGLPMLHRGPVRCVRFSPAGSRVATSSKDGTVRIWDTTFGLPLSEPLRHGYQIDDIAFSKDGRRLLASDLNATIRLWEIPPVTEAVPAWLCDWAEAVVGKKASDAGVFEAISWDEAAAVVARCRSLQDAESCYGKLLTWFYQDSETRKISPFSK